MTRVELLFERFLTGWMDTTTNLMNADNRLLRVLGLMLGIVGIGIAWLFVGLWLLIGKKPK